MRRFEVRDALAASRAHSSAPNFGRWSHYAAPRPLLLSRPTRRRRIATVAPAVLVCETARATPSPALKDQRVLKSWPDSSLGATLAAPTFPCSALLSTRFQVGGRFVPARMPLSRR